MVTLRNSEVEVTITLAGSVNVFPPIIGQLTLFVTVTQIEIFNTYYVLTFTTHLLAKCHMVHRLQTATRKQNQLHT
jgi:hypothetical protein